MDSPPRAFRAPDVFVAGGTLLLLAFALLPLASLKHEGYGANRVICKSNLSQIGRALLVYADENHDLYPDADGIEFLSRLYEIGILDDPHIYLCPSYGESEPASSSRLTPGSCDYGGRRNTEEAFLLTPEGREREGSRQAISADRRIEHHGDARNVLLADGRVVQVDEEEYLRTYASSLAE